MPKKMQELNENKPKEGVLGRSIRSGQWLSIGYIIQKAMGLVSFIILARLLKPSDFGIMAIVLVLPKFIESATDTGFSAAIIQKEGDIKPYLNPIWTIGIMKSLLILVITFVSGPYVASYFQSETVTLAIQLGGIFIVIQNLSNIGETYLFKELDFKKIVIRNVLKDFAYIVTGICFVLIWPSYWALFFATVASYITQTVSTYFLQTYRPKLSFKFQGLKSLVRYSKWVIGQGWIDRLYGFFETSIVARLTNINSLGLFSKAKNMASVIPGFIGPTIRMVSFPAYSKIQENTEKINEGLIKSLQVMCFLLVPTTTLLILAADQIILILLNKNWIEMTPILQIMLIYYFFGSINDALGSIFNAVGKPEKQVKIDSFKMILTIPLIYFLTIKYGIIGASLALAVSILPVAILNIYSIIRLTKVRLLDIMGTIVTPLGSTIIIAIPAIIYKKYILQMPLTILLPLLTLEVIIYLAIIYFTDRFWGRGPFKTIMLIIKHTARKKV